MAHFAELNSENKVIRVLVTDNNDPNGDEGLQFLLDTFGGTWVQTSYNAKIRYNFAGIGFDYDAVNDAFIAPKCHEEAILNKTVFQYECTNGEHERE